MNIVRVNSGLGNQMFQYALFRALYAKSSDTKMDIFSFKYRTFHNGYELEKIFNIQPVYATQKECDKLADVSKNIWAEIRRKVFKVRLKTTGNFVEEGDLGVFFHPEILTMKDTYFSGFWQTEKYFKDIESQLRHDFTFKQPLDDANLKIKQKIDACDSVSIHIRRGDYIKPSRAHILNTCTQVYYERAIAYISQQVMNPVFFFFSDDIDWVKENFRMPHAEYVNINSGTDSYKDMQLMSCCKHNIIANSSFSWWGAWLNARKEKIVLTPSVWSRNIDTPNIVPDHWLKIEIE